MKLNNAKRAPPQLASYDEAHPFAPECPSAVAVREQELTLYDAQGFPDSPIEKEVSAYAPSQTVSVRDV